MPFLTGENDARPHETLFWRLGRKAALRKQDWKLVRNPTRRGSAEWELYDLSQDVSETENLATSQSEKLQELTAAWETLNDQMIDPFWTPTR